MPDEEKRLRCDMDAMAQFFGEMKYLMTIPDKDDIMVTRKGVGVHYANKFLTRAISAAAQAAA